MQYRIDCGHIQTAAELHRILAQTLSFPEWYGHNLDALYDCLTELPEETTVILSNWTEAGPFIWGFHSAMSDAQQDSSNFTVVFE